MATITTGAHPKQLWPGVHKFFGASYNDKPVAANSIFDQRTSDKAYEEVVEETGFGLASVKPEGQAITYDSDKQGYQKRFTHAVYALGAKVSQEAIEDNQYFAVAQRKAGKLSRSMRQTREIVHANIFNRAFNSSYVGGDGKELLAVDHPTLDGTQSNMLAVGADLSEASLEDLLTQIRSAKDSRGLRIQLKGQMLIVPPELEFEATRIVSSVNQSGTANNDVNAMKELGLLPRGVMVWDYLTDADAFFVKTDADDGLMTFNRRGVALAQDNDFDTSNACMKASERYATGWGDWRGLFGSDGA